jgi:microsomal dipeptidase-like Zn-dependent dipeptidase
MTGHGPAAADVVKAIDAIGPDMVVLSTDYGWNSELPRPAAGLLEYVDALWDVGASEAQLRQMACTNPAQLLRMAS